MPNRTGVAVIFAAFTSQPPNAFGYLKPMVRHANGNPGKASHAQIDQYQHCSCYYQFPVKIEILFHILLKRAEQPEVEHREGTPLSIKIRTAYEAEAQVTQYWLSPGISGASLITLKTKNGSRNIL